MLDVILLIVLSTALISYFGIKFAQLVDFDESLKPIRTLKNGHSFPLKYIQDIHNDKVSILRRMFLLRKFKKVNELPVIEKRKDYTKLNNEQYDAIRKSGIAKPIPPVKPKIRTVEYKFGTARNDAFMNMLQSVRRGYEENDQRRREYIENTAKRIHEDVKKYMKTPEAEAELKEKRKKYFFEIHGKGFCGNCKEGYIKMRLAGQSEQYCLNQINMKAQRCCKNQTFNSLFEGNW